jgi:hypothetical protein
VPCAFWTRRLVKVKIWHTTTLTEAEYLQLTVQVSDNLFRFQFNIVSTIRDNRDTLWACSNPFQGYSWKRCFRLWLLNECKYICNVVKKVSCLQTHKERLKHWLVTGFSLLVLAIILHFTNGTYPCIFVVWHGLPFTILAQRFYICSSAPAAIPINKQLYSFSYVCFTGGAAGIVLSAFYILVRFMYTFYLDMIWYFFCSMLQENNK